MNVWVKGLRALLGGCVTWYVTQHVSPDMQRVAVWGVVVVMLWCSEAFPLYVSGLLMTGGIIATTSIGPELFASYGSSVIFLLMGGLVLACLIHDSGGDQVIFENVVPEGTYTGTGLLIRLMGLSAFLSMWMSNTAAAALIIPLIFKLCADQGWTQKSPSFVKRLVIAVAYAATIGGRGTIIGSPTNPLSVSALEEMGLGIDFIDWMVYGLPVVLVLLVLAIGVVVVLFPDKQVSSLYVSYPAKQSSLNIQQKIIFAIAGVTILGWLTTPWTGISSSVIALIPLIAGAGLGVFAAQDIAKIDWPTLLLIGGGIALGSALSTVGWVDSFAHIIQGGVSGMSLLFTLIVVGAAGVLLTMFVSNTASAAVMLPFIMPLAPRLGIDPVILAVFISVAVSLDFTAPMGTPPNAIAYGTGIITVGDMAKAGLILTFVSLVVLSILASWVG